MVSITDIPLDELARQVRQRFGADEANSHEVAAKMLSIAPILVEDLQAYWEKGTISTKE